MQKKVDERGERNAANDTRLVVRILGLSELIYVCVTGKRPRGLATDGREADTAQNSCITLAGEARVKTSIKNGRGGGLRLVWPILGSVQLWNG